MFEKNMKLGYLLDFYIDVLDEHSISIMKAYYEDDLSLAEIAKGEGISRQGIRHIIKKSEEEILFLEERLGLAEHYAALEDSVNTLKEIKERIKDGKVAEDDAARIDSVITAILNKGV